MKVKEHPKTVEVYRWASTLTAESVYEERQEEDFYETEDFWRIMFKAVNQRGLGTLIGIMGLQGSGKTRILYELDKRLWKIADKEERYVVLIKWTQKSLKDLIEDWSYAIFEDELKEGVILHLETELITYANERMVHPKLGRVPNRDDLAYIRKNWRKFISKTKLRQLEEEAVLNILCRAEWILIDLPDYTKSTAHRMNADIDAIQKIWEKLKQQGAKPTFIIAFQKEMVMRHPHFFIGKMDLITLKPLTPQQLVEAYKLRHGTVEPFTEEALNLIGEYSRGIFRRFKKYIQTTIEKNFNAEVPLTPEHVNQAITEEMLIEDMELEMSDIFRSKDHITNAVRILNYLRWKGEANIKTIASDLNLGEQVTQRIVHKLYGYRYVEFKRGKGKEIIVSLKL